MGIVVICGAAAAVNGLFLYMGQTVRNLASQELLPSCRGNTLHRLASILMAVTIGAHLNLKKLRNAGRRLRYLLIDEHRLSETKLVSQLLDEFGCTQE